MATAAMQTAAIIRISQGNLPATIITVGPSAPPMMPMLCASFISVTCGGVPVDDDLPILQRIHILDFIAVYIDLNQTVTVGNFADRG